MERKKWKQKEEIQKNQETVSQFLAIRVKVFIDLLEIIREQRYLDNDFLSREQEEELAKVPGMIVEYYGKNQRTYTLYGNYK